MNRRRQKQFLFGLLFLIIGIATAWGMASLIKNTPEAINGSNDLQSSQEEMFVHYPIRTLGMPSSDRAIILGSVKNQTENKEGKIYFTASILDVFDQVLEEKEGEAIIPPQTSSYILIADLETPYSAINRTEISIRGVSWMPEGSLRYRDFGFSDNKETETADSRRIVVRGAIENKNAVEARRVEILAVLFDSAHNELFAGATIVSNISSFEEREFSITIPFDQDVAEKIDPQQTEFFVADFQ